jgi:hypothetical protein
MVKSANNTRKIPKGKKQVNFNISDQLLEQIKKLAFWENSTVSEILNRAAAKFIELYEKKNGKIKNRPPGRGFDNL